MTVYKLSHQRYIEYKLHTGEPVTENRTIGFFGSEAEAHSCAEGLRDKPGFADSPEDFFIDKYEPEGHSDSVYLVEHTYYVEDDRTDVVVEVGVFCDVDEAMAAAAQYEKIARFPVRSHIWDEFFDIENYLSVAKYELGDIDFGDGFVID